MPRQVEYRIGPITGTARNKTLARERAECDAAEMIGGSYTPVVLYYRGATAFVWREPQSGWGYHIMWPDQAQDLLSKAIWHTTYYDGKRKSAVDGTKFHLVQAMWKREDGNVIDDDTREFLDYKRVDELERWMTWQLHVAGAIDAGLDIEQARYYADYYGNNWTTIDEYVGAVS